MATAPVRRLDANGDVMLGRGLASYLTGEDAVAQRLRSRLLLILGEWFVDTSAGVPWFQEEGSDAQPILGVPRNLAYAEAVIKEAILGTDGVASIESSEEGFVMTVDSQSRGLTVQTTVILDSGVAVSVTVSV